MSPKRPALIFDFGNVVAFFDYTRACESFGPRIGLSGEEFLQHAWQSGLLPVLKEYERGQLTSEAFSKGVCGLTGLDDVSHDEFAGAWADIFTLNEPVARLVNHLKRRGYTLILGSNTNDLHAAQFRRQFADTLVHFDRLVLSYEVGHSKPEAEFYLTCAHAANALPGDCIFIDDMPENVEGARSAGLIGVQFHDVPRLLRQLKELGINDAEESLASSK